MSEKRETSQGWHVGAANNGVHIFADSGRLHLTDRGTTLYPICSMMKGPDQTEDNAHANKIAAVPDMIAIIKALAGRLAVYADGKPMPLDIIELKGWRQRLDRVIARSEGETR